MELIPKTIALAAFKMFFSKQLLPFYFQSYEAGPQVGGVGEYPCSVWHPLKSTAVYFVAWYAHINMQ